MFEYLSDHATYAQWMHFLNLFKYITIRAAFAAVTSFGVVIILGPVVIEYLRRKKIGENTEQPDSAKLTEMMKGKKGTPTMGGILIIASIVTTLLLWGKLDNVLVQIALVLTLAFGALGFVDDYLKLMGIRKKGMPLWTKLFGQVAIGIVIGLLLYWYLKAYYVTSFIDNGVTEYKTSIADNAFSFPFAKHAVYSLGIGIVLWAMIVTVGSSNAVNLTDGLDGLAPGCIVMVGLAYSVICYIVGRIDFTSYLNILYVPDCGEMTIVAAALVGASLGFLWYNCHPAEVFMGDTGSLPLGGLIGYIALVSKHELLLLLIGGVFVVEAVSVLLQVVSFRFFGKRIFRIAPLHHHFQFGGLSESKIINRFWIIAAILALLGLSTLKIR